MFTLQRKCKLDRYRCITVRSFLNVKLHVAVGYMYSHFLCSCSVCSHLFHLTLLLAFCLLPQDESRTTKSRKPKSKKKWSLLVSPAASLLGADVKQASVEEEVKIFRAKNEALDYVYCFNEHQTEIISGWSGDLNVKISCLIFFFWKKGLKSCAFQVYDLWFANEASSSLMRLRMKRRHTAAWGL